MAAALAAAERVLRRLVERLEDDHAAKKRLERKDVKRLIADLKDLSSVWPQSAPATARSMDLVMRLGCQLEHQSSSAALAAVAAFAPLEEDVKGRMLQAMGGFNEVLADLPDVSEKIPEGCLQKLEEQLRSIDEVPYLKSCYRRAGDAEMRVRFLVALALVLKILAEVDRVHSGGAIQELAEKITSHYFTLTLPQPEGVNGGPGGDGGGDAGVLFRWLDGRLARYDRIWRQTAALCSAAGRDAELRLRLGQAVEAATGGGTEKWLQLSAWPMSKCPLAKALCEFAEDFTARSQAEQRFRDCPEHSLRPEALLNVLHDLEAPFQVDEDLGPQGGVCLLPEWSVFKAAEEVKIRQPSRVSPRQKRFQPPAQRMPRPNQFQQEPQKQEQLQEPPQPPQQAAKPALQKPPGFFQPKAAALSQPPQKLPAETSLRDRSRSRSKEETSLAVAAESEEAERQSIAFSKSLAVPAAAPAAAPVGAPAAVPVGAPAAAPVGAPATAPVGAPAAAPVAAPVAAPAAAPATAPAHAPGQYYYPPMPWGTMPGMPPPMMGPAGTANPMGAMGMMPSHYYNQMASMAHMSGADGKKKKDKKDDRSRKKARDKSSGSDSSTHDKKRRRKRDKKEKKSR